MKCQQLQADYVCFQSLGLGFKDLKNIFSACKMLTSVHLDDTDLCSKSISFLCNNLSPELNVLDLSRLKVLDIQLFKYLHL